MIIVPSSGQLQIPGAFQSFARVLLDPSSLGFVQTESTGQGGPARIVPDAGYLTWLYNFQGVNRYGARLPIELDAQYIPTDIPGLEIVHLLAVLRLGVTASISIRRFQV